MHPDTRRIVIAVLVVNACIAAFVLASPPQVLLNAFQVGAWVFLGIVGFASAATAWTVKSNARLLINEWKAGNEDALDPGLKLRHVVCMGSAFLMCCAVAYAGMPWLALVNVLIELRLAYLMHLARAFVLQMDDEVRSRLAAEAYDQATNNPV